MRTSRPLTAIPVELLDEILSYLEPSHLAQLLRCSRQLHRHVQPILYASDINRNKAVRWACTRGQVSSLCIAREYGASLDRIEVESQAGSKISTGSQHDVKVSTLYLAARNLQLDIFRFLIDAGVTLTDLNGNEASSLIKILRDPKYWDFMQLLVNANLHVGIPDVAQSVLSPALLESVRRKDSPEVIQWLLGKGADPNFEVKVRSKEKFELTGMRYDPEPGYKHLRDLESILGNAVLHNATALFDELIASGAKINGVTLDFDPEDYELLNRNHDVYEEMVSKPHHIPIFAAVSVIMEFGTEMLQKCLASGADINQRTRIYRRYPRLNVTPLEYFIMSKKPWQESSHLSYTQVVRYMIDQGAILDLSKEESRRVFGRSMSDTCFIQFYTSLWQDEQMIYDGTQEFVSLLVERGVSKVLLGEHLSMCAERAVDSIDFDADAVEAWRRYVDILQCGQSDEDISDADGRYKIICDCFSQLSRFESEDESLVLEIAMIAYLLGHARMRSIKAKKRMDD